MVTGEGEEDVVRACVNSFPRLPRPRMWIGVVVVEVVIFEEFEKGRGGGGEVLMRRLGLAPTTNDERDFCRGFVILE